MSYHPSQIGITPQESWAVAQRENREQIARETGWPAQQAFPCGCSADLIAAGTYRPMKFCADHGLRNFPTPRGIDGE